MTTEEIDVDAAIEEQAQATGSHVRFPRMLSFRRDSSNKSVLRKAKQSFSINLTDIQLQDAALARELEAIDRNHDGKLTVAEIAEGVRRLQESQTANRHLKQISVSLAVAVCIIVGLVVGLTAFIVDKNQISKYDNNNNLLNKDTNQPVSVSQSITRIPLGALYLFSDTLAHIKDISFHDPRDDSTNYLSVVSVKFTSSTKVVVMTLDPLNSEKLRVVVSGEEARFESTDTNGNYTHVFSICAACSSCGSYSTPKTPVVDTLLRQYYDGVNIEECVLLTNVANATEDYDYFDANATTDYFDANTTLFPDPVFDFDSNSTVSDRRRAARGIQRRFWAIAFELCLSGLFSGLGALADSQRPPPPPPPPMPEPIFINSCPSCTDDDVNLGRSYMHTGRVFQSFITPATARKLTLNSILLCLKAPSQFFEVSSIVYLGTGTSQSVGGARLDQAVQRVTPKTCDTFTLNLPNTLELLPSTLYTVEVQCYYCWIPTSSSGERRIVLSTQATASPSNLPATVIDICPGCNPFPPLILANPYYVQNFITPTSGNFFQPLNLHAVQICFGRIPKGVSVPINVYVYSSVEDESMARQASRAIVGSMDNGCQYFTFTFSQDAFLLAGIEYSVSVLCGGSQGCGMLSSPNNPYVGSSSSYGNNVDLGIIIITSLITTTTTTTTGTTTTSTTTTVKPNNEINTCVGCSATSLLQLNTATILYQTFTSPATSSRLFSIRAHFKAGTFASWATLALYDGLGTSGAKIKDVTINNIAADGLYTFSFINFNIVLSPSKTYSVLFTCNSRNNGGCKVGYGTTSTYAGGTFNCAGCSKTTDSIMTISLVV